MTRKREDPAGYPGDEAVQRAFNRAVLRKCEEKGWSRDDLERRRRALAYDPRWARRALALRLQAIREERGLSRRDLALIANVPLRVLTIAERGGDSGIGVGELMRLCLGLKYDFMKLLHDVDSLRKRLRTEGSNGGAEAT